MFTTETAPQKQGGCNRIKTVLRKESETRGRGRAEKAKERGREREHAIDKEREHNSQGSIICSVTRL